MCPVSHTCFQQIGIMNHSKYETFNHPLVTYQKFFIKSVMTFIKKLSFSAIFRKKMQDVLHNDCNHSGCCRNTFLFDKFIGFITIRFHLIVLFDKFIYFFYFQLFNIGNDEVFFQKITKLIAFFYPIVY